LLQNRCTWSDLRQLLTTWHDAFCTAIAAAPNIPAMTASIAGGQNDQIAGDVGSEEPVEAENR
jgi:hypothetical protein